MVDCSRVIWLGDLNYRLSLSELETWKLVKLSDWESLMKLDEVHLFIYIDTEVLWPNYYRTSNLLQRVAAAVLHHTLLYAWFSSLVVWFVWQLKLEQDEGRVFVNWKEGPIRFPPTYKFMDDSDEYAGEATGQAGEKRRSPAWWFSAPDQTAPSIELAS